MRKLILNLHLYTALLAGVFVVILGVTGSIIAFEDDLDRAFNSNLFTVTPGAQRLPIPAVQQSLRAAFPGQKFSGLHIGSRPDEASYTQFKTTQIFLDPYSARVIGTRQLPTTLGQIHQLHLRLLLGPTGKTIVYIVSLILLWLVVSGVYLWWQYKRVRIQFGGTFRRTAFDAHNAVGIVSALFLFVAALTGVGIHFDDSIGKSMNAAAGQKDPIRTMPSIPSAGAVTIPPDAAILRAKEALPGTEPIAFNEPAGPKGSYYVSLHYPEDLTPGGRSWAVIDQYSGNALFVESSRNAPRGTGMVILNRAIHTGDIGGYATKMLMSLACFMLISQAITGYYLWWKRVRPKV